MRSSPVGSLAQCIFGVKHAALLMRGDAKSAALAKEPCAKRLEGRRSLVLGLRSLVLGLCSWVLEPGDFGLGSPN